MDLNKELVFLIWIWSKSCGVVLFAVRTVELRSFYIFGVVIWVYWSIGVGSVGKSGWIGVWVCVSRVLVVWCWFFGIVSFMLSLGGFVIVFYCFYCWVWVWW